MDGNITMANPSPRNDITFTTGTLNITGTITGGTINSGSGTVNYNNSGNQTIGAYTYYNLTVSNGGTKALAGNTTVNGTLTLTSGVLTIGNLNLTLSSTNAIGGSPFSSTNMVETNGSGYLIRNAGAGTPIVFPVGSNGFYSPVSIASVNPTTGTLSVRTVNDASLGSNYLPRYWDIATTTSDKTITATFTYDAAETGVSPTNIWVRPSGGSWQTPTGTQTFPANGFTITGTTNITTTASTNWTAGLLPDTYFSYQTGPWDQPSTWTSDPGGTTQVGTTVPGTDDVVVILPGRTVTLTDNVATTGLEVNINTGGILDLSTYGFTSGLKALKGTGLLQIASAYFPTVPVADNTFVQAGGGTTEYTNTDNFTMPSGQATYNNLNINITATKIATQLHDITLNGNLHVKSGIYRINDNTATTRLTLDIAGNVTVNSGAEIAVGQRGFNSTLAAATDAGTAPFLNYYEQFHRVVINGNFTNNGTVNFTNLAQPIYDAFPPTTGATAGAATVYFRGSSNSTMLCNGETDFYNLVLDKGSDQTYTLTIQPSAYGNFRLFGANTKGATIASGNPNLLKALWIRNGTLNLTGAVVIPSLTEGTAAGAEYYIPANGALTFNGSSVIVLNTADDAGEVNVAYGVTGTTGVSVNGFQNMVVFGKLQMNSGYLSTRESAGLLYSSQAAGQFEINGGTIDAKQFRTYDGTAIGAAYRQTGGTFILRGRFVRPVAYGSITDLNNTSITYNTRLLNGTTGTYGTFNLEFPDNIFSMTGGTIRIHDASDTPGQQKIVDVGSTLANSSVTGGTIELLPQAGSGLADAATWLVWCKESMYGNLTLNRGTGCTTEVRVRTNPLTILKNLTITSGEFRTNGQNITIGGNFTVSTSGTFFSNSTTIFNGTRKQTFTIDGTINNGNPGLGNIVVNRTADTLKLAGTQPSLIVQGTFDLNGGVFADGGKTVQVAGNITNSGVHTGAGKIQLNGTATQTIGGSGSGVFGNLELNNSNAATAPVSLTVDATITGTLTFTTDKSLSLGSNNLTFETNATVSGSGTGMYRYCTTNGQAGDGGITKKYSVSSTSFTFPLGVLGYTPATIGFGTQPSAYGSITVKPVDYEHPNVTTTGRSLTYFWRVLSTGFTLGSATVSHSYTYRQADVVESGGDPTEAGYVPAHYNPTTFTWTRGGVADVDETNNIISFPAISTIDGEFTAGDDSPTNPFGTPIKYFSRQTGPWANGNTWSTVSHSGPAAGTWPGASDIVIIGNGHTISFGTPPNYLTIPNTEVHNCATLQIEQGGVLDTRFNPASTFRTVISHPNGNGTIRVAADQDNGSTFMFPQGDFSDFDENSGTTELYSTNTTTGTTFWLPNGKGVYGNLTIIPAGRSNIIFPNNNVTVNGNCVINGPDPRSWFCLTWDGNYPTAPTVRVSKTITVKGDFNLQGGSLGWYGGGGGGAQNVVVYGNVFVSTLSGIDVWSSNTSQSLSIGGSLINNTTGTVWSTASTSHCDFSLLPVTFFGPNSASITNTGGTPVTIFSTLTVNKGTSQETTLTCDIAGTLTTPATNWLTLQNGTFRYERTGDLQITTNNTFTIPSTAGLYINTPSNVYLSYANNDGNDVYLEGKLTLAPTNTGTVYIGDPTRTRNNDIEYAGGGDSEIEVNGGNLIVNGQIRRNPSMAGGILKYTQTGGTVTINGQNQSPVNAKFEVCNTGSVFNMSGGTLTIRRGGGDATYGDVYIRPHTSSVTGGTIDFANNTGAAQSYRLDASVALNNLTISNTGTAATRVNLMVNPLTLNGNLLLSNQYCVLNTNSINVTIKGNLQNNGLPGSYLYGTNTTTFSGGVQEIGGSSTTNFYNLTINPVTSVTRNNGATNYVTVYGNLAINSGTLYCNNQHFHVRGNLTNNSAYDGGASHGIIMNGTAEQTVGGGGNYARLEINNSFGVKALTDLSLSRNLALSSGVFNIGDHKLSLSSISQIEGSGFGATKMIATNGVFSDSGIEKTFPTGAGSFSYPLGVSGKYTPVDVSISTSTKIGTIRVVNVNDRHPAVIVPDSVLKYYWSVESFNIEGFTGSLVFNYLDADVQGLESNYDGARLEGTTWGFPGVVNTSSNTITYNIVSPTDYLGDEYTAGRSDAFPDDIPVFRTKQNGPWNDPDTWEQTAGDTYPLTSGGPNGFIVIIDSTVTTDRNYCKAYRTTLNGTFRSVTPYSGHNLGMVTGSGTLYLESQVIPAGKFTNFFNCANNSTLEYGGSGTYTLIADLYNQIPILRFTGTGTRVLPPKDLTICNLLEIDGPTLDNSVNNQKLTILGDMVLTSGAFKSGSGSTATVAFAGSSAQNVSNFKGTNSFNNLEINNAAGLTLDDDIEVAGNLILTKGLINSTATNTLKITNPLLDCVLPTGGSKTSYVNGPLIKSLNEGITYFRFPVGNSTACGNKLSLRFTDKGPLDWTITYVNPNDIGTTLSGDLTAVNDVEYWNVTSNASSDYKAVINIAWDPSSNLTPLMTEFGEEDMRVARHNGTYWVELASGPTSGSDPYNGSAQTDDQNIIATGNSANYTLACVNVVKPRIRLAPTGPICGDAGIPIQLSTSYTIYSPYTVYYTRNGGATQTLTPSPTSFPATLPTDPLGGVYKLVGFKYNNPSGTERTGVVDGSAVTVYQRPSNAYAGPDQSLCGGTSATLDADVPTVGTGLWSIITAISGPGGSVTYPTNEGSPFIGIAGNSYFIKWTVSNGACTDADTVKIVFPLNPVAPTTWVASTTPVCQGVNDVEYTVNNNPLNNRYNWTYSGGISITDTINQVFIDFPIDAISGTLSVTASNDCGTSSALSLPITVRTTPRVNFNLATSIDTICDGDNTSLVIAITSGSSPYTFTITEGSHPENYIVVGTDTTVQPTTPPIWLGPSNPSDTYTYSIPTITDKNGCSNMGSNTINVEVFKRPETGPQYHVPNTFGF